MMVSVIRPLNRKIAGLAAAALLSVFSLAAQSGGTSQVRYTSTVYDFGTIREADGPVTAVFEFTNTSDTPFILDFVSVSCGCTTPQYSREPVLPGRTGEIKVSYDPAGRPGVFDRMIVATSNNRRDQVQLTIKGEVIGKPKSIEEQFPVELHQHIRGTANTALLGYVPRGTRKTQSVDIYNTGEKPVRIDYELTTPGVGDIASVEIVPATVPAHGRAQVNVTYDLRGVDVWGQQNFSFVLTADEVPSRYPVTVYATVTDDFSQMTEKERENAPKAAFSSQYHNFNKVGRNKTLTKTFELKNEGQSPLVIRHVGNTSSHLDYSISSTTIAPGKTATVTLTLKTGSVPQKLSEYITLVLNDPARPLREVRVGATVE